MYRLSRSLEQFRTQSFLRKESTAVQRCARKSTEFGSGSKIVGENRGEMGISLVTQDAALKGFCWTFPLYRPSRSLKQFRTQGFLRIESTAVQRCARKSVKFASGSKIVGENRGEMENSKFLKSHRILRIEGSAEHCRCACVDGPSRSHREQIRTKGSAHRAY